MAAEPIFKAKRGASLGACVEGFDVQCFKPEYGH